MSLNLKSLFITATQHVLKDAGLLLKEVDGVWDAHTQNAYAHVAQKQGMDAQLAMTQQPSKIEHLEGDLKTAVAAKMADLSGAAPVDTAQAAAPSQIQSEPAAEQTQQSTEQHTDTQATQSTDGEVETKDEATEQSTDVQATEQSTGTTDGEVETKDEATEQSTDGEVETKDDEAQQQ